MFSGKKAPAREDYQLDISTAIELSTTITKSGYLVKRAVESGMNWKRRYFVLNDHTLTYYKDHKHTAVARGDLLLMPNTVTKDFVKDNKNPYAFTVTTAFKELKLLATTAEERQEWKEAIHAAVQALSQSMRGYLYKKAGIFDAWKRTFFVLHRDALTYHYDHHHTAKIEGAIQLTHTTVLELSQNLTLALMDIVTKRRIIVLKADTEESRRKWERCISQAIIRLQKTDDKVMLHSGATERILRQGKVLAKGFRTEEGWDECYVVLTPSKLYQYEEEKSVEPLSVYNINTSCSVFETNLQRHSFQLVTAERVLHACTSSTYETAEWVRLVRDAILNSVMDDTDPLLASALKREDEFYEVTFREHKPLGIVLERAGEWAVVRVSNSDETSVFRGSALTHINGRSMILSSYMDTIRELSGWKPPLTLGFRKSPSKSGWLTKQARARRKAIKNWKPRYFILTGGRLTYYNNDQPGSELRGDVQLMGSVVSLVSHLESGQHFTFKLVSGVTVLLMQAVTVEEMMEWASTLYHAIAIANGGGYLLDKEKRKQAFLAESEDQRRNRLDETRNHLSIRLERKSLLDLRLEEANVSYVKSKAERERADAALSRLRQEYATRPSEHTGAILKAAEDEATQKRDKEANALRQKVATFQEADHERKEAIRLQQVLEEHEALLAEEEYTREQERLSMERRIADTDQIQEALDADKQVRLQAMIEAELENLRSKELIDELRMSIRGWVDMEDMCMDDDLVPMEERLSVRMEQRNSVVSDSDSDIDNEPASMIPFENHESKQEVYDELDGPLQVSTRTIPILDEINVHGQVGGYFAPVHSNRQSVRSIGSISVDEIQDEPVQVHTEQVVAQEVATVSLAATPKPLAAVKVRSFRVASDLEGDHEAAVLRAGQHALASTPSRAEALAHIANKHLLSSASATFQELRRRPVSMRSEESDVLRDLTMRGSIDSSSTGLFQDSDYEAGDEGDERQQGWQVPVSPSSAASVTGSMASSEAPTEVRLPRQRSPSANMEGPTPEVCQPNGVVIATSMNTSTSAALSSMLTNLPSEGDIEDNLDTASEVASEVYPFDATTEQPWVHHPAVKRNSKSNHRTNRGSVSARTSRHSRVQDDDSTEDDDQRPPHERKPRREHRSSAVRSSSFKDTVSANLLGDSLLDESDRGNDGDVSEIYRLDASSVMEYKQHRSINTSATEYDSPDSDKSSLVASPRRPTVTPTTPAPPSGLAWKLEEISDSKLETQTTRPVSQQLNTSSAWKELMRQHSIQAKEIAAGTNSHDSTEITDQMMSQVYATLAVSDGGESHILPVTFSNLLRTVTGEQNLFKEMQLFHLFDQNNMGRLNIHDFTEGIRKLERTGPHGQELALRIKRFIRHSLATI